MAAHWPWDVLLTMQSQSHNGLDNLDNLTDAYMDINCYLSRSVLESLTQKIITFKELYLQYLQIN